MADVIGAAVATLWHQRVQQLVWTPHPNLGASLLCDSSPSDWITVVNLTSFSTTVAVLVVSLCMWNLLTISSVVETQVRLVLSAVSNDVRDKSATNAPNSTQVEPQSALVESMLLEKAAERLLQLNGPLNLNRPMALNIDVTRSNWSPMSIALAVAIWTNQKSDMSLALSNFTWTAKRGIVKLGPLRLGLSESSMLGVMKLVIDSDPLDDVYDTVQEKLKPFCSTVETHAVIGSYIRERADFTMYNTMPVDDLFKLITNPKYCIRNEGYDSEMIRASQSQGSDAAFSVDPAAARYACMPGVLDEELYHMVCKDGTISGGKKGRYLAIFKHARAVCIIHPTLKGYLDQFRWGWLASQCPQLNKTSYNYALDLVEEYEASGQWEPLSTLGLDGASHDGYPAPRGIKKRDNAWATAAMLREFRITRSDTLKSQLLTFNHTVRTKDAPLTVPQVITDRHARIEVQNSVLHASRMVTYGSTPTVAIAKPFIESFSRGVMSNPNRMVVYQPDSFEPGALRRFFQTWFLIFSSKLPYHDRLMTSPRWDDEILSKARSTIQSIPNHVLDAFFALKVRVIDLSGSDSRTPSGVTSTWLEFCIQSLESQNAKILDSTKDLLRSFAVAMADGNLNVGDANLRFTRANMQEENKARAPLIGSGYLDTMGEAEKSTLSSGSSAVYIANSADVSESTMPFTNTEGLPRELDQEGNNRIAIA